MITLTTVDQVIEALGGDIRVAERYGRTPQNSRNWRYQGCIPPGYRDAIDDDLRPLGKRSADSVYRAYRTYAVKLPRRKGGRNSGNRVSQ